MLAKSDYSASDSLPHEVKSTGWTAATLKIAQYQSAVSVPTEQPWRRKDTIEKPQHCELGGITASIAEAMIVRSIPDARWVSGKPIPDGTD